MRIFTRLMLCCTLVVATQCADAAEGPRTPQAAGKTFQLTDDALAIELVASEPDVQSPVAIAWDADGKMFVAEMIGYPETEGQGRIRRLEDRDGDGHYELSTVFADRLNFPTSVLPHRDGILVTAAPDILFLSDTDGDGVADLRRVEWTGFGTGSQQLRANALHRGLDNWIYGANGRCGGILRRPEEPASAGVDIHGRDFRFDLEKKKIEAIAGQSQFGQAHNDWGDRFLNWNTIPVRQVVVPQLYLKHRDDLRPLAVRDTAPAGASPQVFPISPPPAQFNGERADHYNALCGLTVYRGAKLDNDYQNDAFVCESLTNLILHRHLAAEGPVYVSRRAEDERAFLASTDSWFHPVNLATGPDGGLYVADFYRQYVEHPRYVASETAREETPWQRGKDRGRIWRIRSRSAPHSATTPRLSKASTEQLIETLDHPNGWWRDTAQRLLVERQDPQAIPLLQKFLAQANSPQGKIHAAWTLHGLGGLSPNLVQQMLESEHAQVRRQGIRLGAATWDENPKIAEMLCGLHTDPEAVVRFELALALAEHNDPRSIASLRSLAERDYADRWISEAVLAADCVVPLIARLATNRDWQASLSAPQLDFLVRAGRRLGMTTKTNAVRENITQLLASDAMRTLSDAARTLLLAGLARAVDARDGDLKALLSECPPAVQQPLRQSFKEAARLYQQQSVPNAIRVALVNLLAAGPENEAAPLFEKVLRTSSDPLLLQAAARGLGRLGKAQYWLPIYAEWDGLSRQSRQSILHSAPGSAAHRDALYAALSEGQITPQEIPFAVAATLSQQGEAAERARFVAMLKTEANADRTQVLRNFADVETLTGNIERGGALFSQHCQSCHAMLGRGRGRGPDLSGAGRRTAADLLRDILDPSQTISPDYLQYEVTTRGGKVFTGLITEETDTALSLCDAQGKITPIARDELLEMRALPTSLMPNGVETKIDHQAMADLIAFLRNPARHLLADE